MKPFDLEAAKRGDPIVCRDGTRAKFIAHVPELDEDCRVLFLRKGFLESANEKGVFDPHANQDTHYDLFMAPKKRTVWVNFYENCRDCYAYDSEKNADIGQRKSGRIGGKAYPVEIDV